MDRRTFILSASAATISAPAFAAPVLGPEYLGVFAALGPNGKLIDLERQMPTMKAKMKHLGFAGAESFYEFAGPASPVRFRTYEFPPLVVRVASQAVDPMSIIQLFKLQVVKGTRKLVAQKVNPFGVGIATTGNESAIPMNIVKHGSDFFKIQPATPLLPGEYGISLTTTQAGFLFGVDL